jgi:cell wall-associated NlpC family hydrolase
MGIKKCFIMILMTLSGHCNCLSQIMRINKNVTNLRRKPKKPQLTTYNSNILYKDNPLQNSQLLLYEKIKKIEEHGNWIKVKALEQKKFNQKTNKWDFLTGWIQSKDATPITKKNSHNNIVINKPFAKIFLDQNNSIIVSLGTKLPIISQNTTQSAYTVQLPNQQFGTIKKNNVYILSNLIQEDITILRKNIVNTAKLFLDTPYSGGGRSFYNAHEHNQQSGVDCSAMINLVYRAHGLQIPRKGHDQFLYAKSIAGSITGKQLKTGDLIFFANFENKINHVLLYIGNGNIIHCTGKGKKKGVQITTDTKFLKKQIQDIISGEIIHIPKRGKTKIFFGTFLKNKKTIQHLRLQEINN